MDVIFQVQLYDFNFSLLSLAIPLEISDYTYNIISDIYGEYVRVLCWVW